MPRSDHAPVEAMTAVSHEYAKALAEEMLDLFGMREKPPHKYSAYQALAAAYLDLAKQLERETCPRCLGTGTVPRGSS